MSPQPLINHAVVIGLGLIGGSIALELKERQIANFVFGYDTSEKTHETSNSSKDCTRC